MTQSVTGESDCVGISPLAVATSIELTSAFSSGCGELGAVEALVEFVLDVGGLGVEALLE
jgi:hypothetical protein